MEGLEDIPATFTSKAEGGDWSDSGAGRNFVAVTSQQKTFFGPT
jgi:hypothetical protein